MPALRLSIIASDATSISASGAFKANSYVAPLLMLLLSLLLLPLLLVAACFAPLLLSRASTERRWD